MALLHQHKRRARSKKRKILRLSNADEVTFLPHLIIDDTGSGAVNFQVTRKTCLHRLLMPSIGDRYPDHRGKPEHLRVAQKGNC